MDELKPCPFCGGEGRVVVAHPAFMLKKLHWRYVTVVCTKCGCNVVLTDRSNRTGSPLMNAAHEKEAEKIAIEAWNRRPEETN